MRRCLKLGIRMKMPDRMAPQMSEYVLQSCIQVELQQIDIQAVSMVVNMGKQTLTDAGSAMPRTGSGWICTSCCASCPENSCRRCRRRTNMVSSACRQTLSVLQAKLPVHGAWTAETVASICKAGMKHAV